MVHHRYIVGHPSNNIEVRGESPGTETRIAFLSYHNPLSCTPHFMELQAKRSKNIFRIGETDSSYYT